MLPAGGALARSNILKELAKLMSSDKPDLIADHIVVGVGASGALMVSKLISNDCNSVIAIEAGENRSQDEILNNSLFAGLEFGLEDNALPIYLYSQIPARNGSMVSAEENPDIAITAGCNKIIIPGFNGAEESEAPENVGIYTTGYVLGGGSRINGLQYARGTVYDEWGNIGGDQWSNESIYKYFCELENYNGESGVSDSHCYNGDLNIRQAPVTIPTMTSKFLSALKKGLNVDRIENDDYNDLATPTGSFGRWQLFQYPDGTRASSDVSFLSDKILNSGHNCDEVSDGPLTMLFKAKTTQIIWSKDKHQEGCTFDRLYEVNGNNSKCSCKNNGNYTAIGVKVIHNGICRKMYANKKVILCAGIFSAELLQRSGVGPRKLLKCLDIPVIYDNINVGRHLKNHLFVPIIFSANKNDLALPPNDLEALYTGGAFLAPLIPEDNYNLRGYQLIGGSPSPGIFLIILLYLQPHSEGIVQIQSTDPLKISLVDNNYLGDPLDIAAFVAAIREYIVPLSEGFAEVDKEYKLISPSSDIIDDDEAIIAFVKDSFDHSHHWASSNRMAKSPKDGVVDGNGNVFGVNNLVIADISISPIINDGNTNATAYAVASTIADILLKD